MSIETTRERENTIAIANAQADNSRYLASIHSAISYALGTSEILLINGESALNAANASIVASNDIAATYYRAANAAGSAIDVANVQSAAEYFTTNLQVGFTKNDASYQVRQTNSSSDAQTKAIAAETAARNASSARVTALNAAESDAETAIRVSQLATIAASRSSGAVVEANVRAAGTAANAATRVNEVNREASIEVTNTGLEAAILADADIRDANYRAAYETATAGFQVAQTNASAANQVIATAGTAKAESNTTLKNSATTIREQTTNAAALNVEITSNALTEARTTRYQAESRYASQVFDSDSSYAAAKAAADYQDTGDRSKSDQNLKGDQYQADGGLLVTKYDSASDLGGRVLASTLRSEADRSGADIDLAALYAHEAVLDSRQASLLAYAEAHFQEVWKVVGPIAETQGVPVVTTPGFIAKRPRPSQRGVYTQSQVQRQVNRAYATTAATLRSASLDLREDLSGRGFGVSTPFVLAMESAAEVHALAQSTSEAAGIRVSAASENASRYTSAQEQRNESFMAQQRAVLGAESNAIQREVGVLKALSGIVSRVL